MRVFLLEKNERKPYMDMIPDLSLDGGLFLAAYMDDDVDGTVHAGESVAGVLYANGKDEDLFIRYIFVDEDFRRRGVARTLLSSLYTMAGPLLSDRILISFVEDDATKDLTAFFDAMGYRKYNMGIQSCFLLCDAYEAIEKFGNHKIKVNIQKFCDLDSKSFYALSDRLNEKVEKQRKEDNNKNVNAIPVVHDMFWKPIEDKGSYLDESVVAFSPEGTPLGCVLFKPVSETEILLDYLCIFEKNGGTIVMNMLQAATACISDVYNIKTRILCHTINSASSGLLGKLKIRGLEELGKVSVLVQEL